MENGTQLTFEKCMPETYQMTCTAQNGKQILRRASNENWRGQSAAGKQA